MCLLSFFYFIQLLSFVWGLAPVLTKPNGDLDIDSLTSHIVNLEQMVQDLQTHSQTQEQKQAAVLSSVLSKLASMTEDLSEVKGELSTLKLEHNSTLSELANVKDDLTITTAKLADVSAELSSLSQEHNSTVVELEGLKYNFLSMKMDFQASRRDIALINSEINVINASAASIVTMSSEISILSSNISLVHTNVEAAKHELKSVESGLKTNEANITSLVSDVAHLMTTSNNIASLQTDVHDVKTDLRKLNVSMLSTQPGKEIMFNAQVRDDITIRAIIGSPVKFGKVIYNAGAGYDNNTGVFHAPVAGIYIFMVHIVGKANHEVHLQIKVNGIPLRVLHFGDASVIRHLTAGVAVTVEGSNPAAHHGTITIVGSGFSQFAGILVRADHD